MANSVLVQLLEDGPRNALFKVVGLLDTADLSLQVLMDPALLSSMQPGMSGYPSPDRLVIRDLKYNIQDTTAVELYWDATVPVLFENLTGRGHDHYQQMGFLQNNAGAEVTGKIKITTKSSSTPSVAAPVHFTLFFWCIKQSNISNIADGEEFLGGYLNFSVVSNSDLIPIIL